MAIAATNAFLKSWTSFPIKMGIKAYEHCWEKCIKLQENVVKKIIPLTLD